MRILMILSASFSAAVFSWCYLPGVRLLVALCAGIMLLAILLKTGKIRRKAALLALVGCCGGLIWSGLYGAAALEAGKGLDGTTRSATGEVCGWPSETPYGTAVPVRLDRQDGRQVRTMLYLSQENVPMAPGDRVAGIMYLQRADRDTQGAIRHTLTAEGFYLQARLRGRLTVQRPERPPLHYLPLYWAHRLKASIQSSMEGEDAGLIVALVTGDKGGLEAGWRSDLQRTGLSHVVAVSGMHLILLTSVLHLFLRKGRKSTVVLLVLAMSIFCAMIGFTPSVIRAAFMMALTLSAPLFGRERDDATAVSFALALLLLRNPFAAANVGLQLSFGAVAGILTISGRLRSWLVEHMPWAMDVKGPVERLCRGGILLVVDGASVSLGAMLFTVPISALHFRTVSLMVPLANILLLWMVSVLFVGGTLMAAVGCVIPPLGLALGKCLAPLAALFRQSVTDLAALPYASLPLDVGYYGLWLLGVYCLIASYVLWPGRRRADLPVLLAGVTLIFSVHWTKLQFMPELLTVTALDVGRGQSLVLRTSDSTVMVDCGGNRAGIAGDMAADLLQATGVRHIDHLVLTQLCPERTNGTARVMDRLEVGELLLPDVDGSDPGYRELMALAEEHGTEVSVVSRETHLDMGEAVELNLYMTGRKNRDEGLAAHIGSPNGSVFILGHMSPAEERHFTARGAMSSADVVIVAVSEEAYVRSACTGGNRPGTVILTGESGPERDGPEDLLRTYQELGVRAYYIPVTGRVTLDLNESIKP